MTQSSAHHNFVYLGIASASSALTVWVALGIGVVIVFSKESDPST